MKLQIPNIYTFEKIISSKLLAEKAFKAMARLEEMEIKKNNFVLLDSSMGVDFFSWALACILKEVTMVPISPFLLQSKEKIADLQSLFNTEILISEKISVADKPSRKKEAVIIPTFAELPNSIWAIIMSSGSTGEPKAVVLSKENFFASAQAHRSHHGDSGLWLSALPLHHIGGLSVFTRALFLGQDFAYAEKFSPATIIEWIRKYPITHTSMVPTMLYRCLKDKACVAELKKLKAILLGGAPASEELLQRAREERISILTSYGLTESCSQIVTSSYEEGKRSSYSVGKALAGVELKISDKNEILVKGKMLSSGYWQLNHTVKNILTNEGFFPTGDMGEINSVGHLRVWGRRDDLIISGGLNIYPQEIEEVISSIAGVSAAVVFGIADLEWGQKLVAMIEMNDNSSDPEEKLSQDKIKNFLKQKIDPRKVPKEIIFVPKLPRTNSEKIIRHKVAELWKKNSAPA